ncbi:MAG: TetR/AcrR family transcriptional regulator [Deltaproteobacteria bacterium]|nr:TetR/AcrR family transcriptional regulator [Deltaproteobacteria bacterium]
MNLKERIIYESLRLFSRNGFLNTSISDIMDAAKISKGGFYNHFKTKEDLLLAVLDEARKVWRDRNLAGVDDILQPMAKIKKLLENYRDRYLKDEEALPGGCIFLTLSVELDPQEFPAAREITDGFDRVRRLLNRLLEQAKESGELRREVDTAAVAEMLFAGLLGAAVLHGTTKSSLNLDRAINALLAYLDGLAPR